MMMKRPAAGLAKLCAVVLGVALMLVGRPARAIDIKRATLSNGAVLLVAEQHQLPMVTVSIALDAGARRDPPGKEGLAALTAAALMQGTSRLSASQFNEQVDFIGSALSVGAEMDYAGAGFTSVSRYRSRTLKLLSELLEEPGLRDADIERKRSEQVAAIKASQQQPGYVARLAFRKQLFGSAPYGHPVEGLASSVARLTPSDVRSFYRRYYRMGGAVIAVVGDVNAAAVKSELERSFARLRGRPAEQAAPGAPALAPALKVELINRDLAQATVLAGSAGIARSNPDYYRLKVMNYILGGGGFASRLVKVVRSQAGLAYSVASWFEADKFVGPFVVALQTKNRSANAALKLVIEQLRRMKQEPVSDAELDSAKRFLIGSFPLKLDRQSAIARFLLQIELYGLGLDYADRYPALIGAVTKADVEAVARKYLHPGRLLVVVVANQDKARIDPTALRRQASPAALPTAARTEPAKAQAAVSARATPAPPGHSGY